MVRTQRIPGAAGHSLRYRSRHLLSDPHAAGRDSRSLGCAGHHLHRVPGAGAAGRGRPGYLSAEHGHAGRAEIQGGAGLSVFGASFIYVIFEDDTDIYWARTRVLEYLNFASGRMPRGVTPTLGPDATGVGWVYQYVVLAAQHTLAELRTIQDWFVRYQLTKAQGVAEVASVGGFVKTYQVTVEPRKLQAYGIPLSQVAAVIRASNRDVGGRVIEMAETEYVVRGRGYLRGIADIENLVVKAEQGTPVLIRDVARVELAPDERRGIAELNGEGEVVSGIAVARYGQNALDVIDNLKSKDCGNLQRSAGGCVAADRL